MKGLLSFTVLFFAVAAPPSHATMQTSEKEYISRNIVHTNWLRRRLCKMLRFWITVLFAVSFLGACDKLKSKEPEKNPTGGVANLQEGARPEGITKRKPLSEILEPEGAGNAPKCGGNSRFQIYLSTVAMKGTYLLDTCEGRTWVLVEDQKYHLLSWQGMYSDPAPLPEEKK